MHPAWRSSSYKDRVRTDRAYSATRKTMESVARDSTTPRVIEPAIRTIVTIVQGIGTIRVLHQGGSSGMWFATVLNFKVLNFKVCDDDFRMR